MNNRIKEEVPIYNTRIVEGVDNIKNFSLYDDDGVTLIDISTATVTYAMLSNQERKEFACTITNNIIELNIPDTEVFLSKRYTHRLEMTINGIKSRVFTGEAAIEEDV